MTRLSKFDVEALMNGYDADPLSALTAALAKVLDRPELGWRELLAAAPLSPARRAALLAHEQAALDELARELNELRTL